MNIVRLLSPLLFGALSCSVIGACAQETAPEIQEEVLPLLEPEFVMNQIILLDSDEGFDLTGDGHPNNGLALLFEDPMVGPALGGDPNDYIDQTIQRAQLLLLLDFRNVHDFQNDKQIDIDIFLGHDFDGDRSNNFDGSEFSVTCSSITSQGEADSQFLDAELKEGRLNGTGGSFRFLVSFSNTEVLLQNARIVGTLDSSGENITNGMIGGSVSFDDLKEVVENDPEIGPSFGQLMLAFLQNKLDTDLDEDGELDALSASFQFEATRALIDTESPCAE